MESDTRMTIIVIFLNSTYKLTKLEYYNRVCDCVSHSAVNERMRQGTGEDRERLK